MKYPLRIQRLCLFVSLIICALSVYYQAKAQTIRTDWPMIGGDPARSSYAKMNLEFPLMLKHTVSIGYNWDNGISLSGDQLFIGDYGDPNKVIATNVQSGGMLWSFNVPGSGGGMQYTPAHAHGIILAGGQNGKGLYGLDAYTGDSLWHQPIKSLYTRSPIIADSQVFVATTIGLYCIDLFTGETNWNTNLFTPQHAPAADSELVFFTSADTLFACDQSDGSVIWKNGDVILGHYTSLSVDNQSLYVAHDSVITTLNKLTGEVRWDHEIADGTVVNYYPGALALHPEALVVKVLLPNSSQDEYQVLNKSTGEMIRSFPAFKQYAAPTIINDDVVEFLEGHLRFLHIRDGSVTYEQYGFPVTGHQSQIIAANNQIILSGHGPNLLVLEGQTTSTQGIARKIECSLYPNPNDGTFQMEFYLHQPSPVTLSLYNLHGQLLQVLDLGQLESGRQFHPIRLDVPAGMYSLHLNTKEGETAQRMCILK